MAGRVVDRPRVQHGYVAYWQQYWDNHPQWQRFARPAAYADLKCQPQLAVNGDPTANPAVPPWQIMPFSGAIGEHGVHFFVTQDSDNATAAEERGRGRRPAVAVRGADGDADQRAAALRRQRVGQAGGGGSTVQLRAFSQSWLGLVGCASRGTPTTAR